MNDADIYIALLEDAVIISTCYGLSLLLNRANPSPRGSGGQGGLLMTFAGDAPGSDCVELPEVILDVGSEGGSLTIVGGRAADGWHFRFVKRRVHPLARFSMQRTARAWIPVPIGLGSII